MGTPVFMLETSKNTTPPKLPRRLTETPYGQRRSGPVVITEPTVADKPAADKLQRLRVLLVIEAAGGGTGRHVIDLARGLSKRNHNVCLAYSADRAEPGFCKTIEALDNVELFQLPMSRSVGLHDRRSVRELRKLIEECGPFDILHGHSSKAGALLRLAHRGLPGQCIYTPHAMVTLDPDLGFVKRLLYTTAERYLARLCDRIICVSDEEKTHATGYGIPERLLTVVNNGISPDADAKESLERHWARNYLRLDDDVTVIGSVGRLSHQKAFDRLIRAFAMIALRQPKLILVLIGEGPKRKDAEKLASDLGVSGQVIFTGAESGRALMPAFDIFALSSRYEGFPYVLLEAASCGLPIVMTAVGGATAMVEDGESGFVVKQNDLTELAARLATLAGDTRVREKMGRASAARAESLTMDQMVSKTLRVYEDALQSDHADN